MRITIDTKEDSREEIKRTIHFLTALLGEGTASNFSESDKNLFSDSESSETPSTGGNALTSIFGNDSSSETPTIQPEEKEEPEDPDAQVEFIY